MYFKVSKSILLLHLRRHKKFEIIARIHPIHRLTVYELGQPRCCQIGQLCEPRSILQVRIYISGCGLLTPRRWYAPTNPRTESKPFYLVLLVREKILIQRSGKIKKRPSPIIKIKKYKNCLRVPTIQYLSTNPTLPTFNLLPPFPFVWRFRVFANNVSST